MRHGSRGLPGGRRISRRRHGAMAVWNRGSFFNLDLFLARFANLLIACGDMPERFFEG